MIISIFHWCLWSRFNHIVMLSFVLEGSSLVFTVFVVVSLRVSCFESHSIWFHFRVLSPHRLVNVYDWNLVLSVRDDFVYESRPSLSEFGISPGCCNGTVALTHKSSYKGCSKYWVPLLLCCSVLRCGHLLGLFPVLSTTSALLLYVRDWQSCSVFTYHRISASIHSSYWSVFKNQ